MVFMPPMLQAPARPTPAPQTPRAPARGREVAIAEAEGAILQAFDEGWKLPRPSVSAGNRAALAWLQSNALPATEKGPQPVPLPSNPFKPGSWQYREAQAWRAFLKAPASEWDQRLKDLPLGLTGTQLGLWRWGQTMTLKGRLATESRHVFEDRLASSPLAWLRGYALRHALCHAVAEKDELRFSGLRQKYVFLEEDLFRQFQQLFSLLGGPAPVFRLYGLPGLDYSDISLGDLGGQRIWMMPAGPGLESLPPDVAWIIPSEGGGQSEEEANLRPAILQEAESLAERFKASRRTAYFAASRAPFETYGLVHFPILIELDGKKWIRSIRMGDAAPLKP